MKLPLAILLAVGAFLSVVFLAVPQITVLTSGPVPAAAQAMPKVEPILPADLASITSQAEDSAAPLPSNLILNTPVTFPVIISGRSAGHATAGRGAQVKLFSDDGTTVRVKLVDAVASVPRHSVTPEVQPLEPPGKILASALSPSQKTGPAWSQNVRDYWFPAGASKVGLYAHESGTAKSLKRNWQTDYGSYDRDYKGTKTLRVDVTNIARSRTGPIELGIHWIGREKEGEARFCHHVEKYNLDVPEMSKLNVESTCPPLTSNVQNYQALGVRYSSGARLDGWIAVIRDRGKVMRAIASAGYLYDLCSRPAELEALLSYSKKARAVPTPAPRPLPVAAK